MQLLQIQLSDLRFGHEFPDADINSRVTGRDDEIKKMARSIDSEGLLQPLLVCAAPESGKAPYYTIDGNRRLAALRSLHELDDDDEISIPAMLYDGELSPLDALRKSLVANDLRLPLHPVDRHETFAKCFADGNSITDIAAKYGTDERMVKQSLAIGKLAPEIRKDWRAGKLTAETAKAFTLLDGHKKQTSLYKNLSKRNRFDAEDVRSEIGAMERNIGPGIAFVGREAFEAAGGHMVDDLFGYVDKWDDAEQSIFTPIVSDPELLDRMVKEKLAAKCEALIADGWSWASVGNDLPQVWPWAWQRLKGVSVAASTAQKQKSGCVLILDETGQLDIVYGVVKPNEDIEKKKKAAMKAEAKANGNQDLETSQSLRADLIEQLAHAAAQALPSDTDAALAVLIAGHMTGGNDAVKISVDGVAKKKSLDRTSLISALDLALKMSRDEKISYLASMAAETLDFTMADKKETDAIAAAIPKEAFKSALEDHFKIDDYFGRMPKDAAIAAVKEMCGKDAAAGLETKKKGEVSAYATDKLRGTGWLPKELRTPHYAATSDVKKPANKKSKSAKKLAGKKPAGKKARKS